MSLITVERPSDRRAVSSDLGFIRVDQVRVVVSQGRAVADATGITHRYPVTRRVALSAAVRLAEAGVPVHIEHLHPRGAHD